MATMTQSVHDNSEKREILLAEQFIVLTNKQKWKFYKSFNNATNHAFIIYIIFIHNKWKYGVCWTTLYIVSFEIVKINKFHVLWTHFIHKLYYSQIWVSYTYLKTGLTTPLGHCVWENTVKTLNLLPSGRTISRCGTNSEQCNISCITLINSSLHKWETTVKLRKNNDIHVKWQSNMEDLQMRYSYLSNYMTLLSVDKK